MNEEKKKYSGYGYHGGGRPKKLEEEKHKVIQLSGTKEELNQLRELAKAAGKSTSKYVLDKLLRDE